MKLWDPHFHLWDVSPETTTGHDPSQLFAPGGAPVYDRTRYESDAAGEGFEFTGGALVEAVSVCHVDQDGPRFAQACVAEARWVSEELAASPHDYVVVASAPLEDPNLPAILDEIAGNCPGLRGIRQILNHEPSWPRNESRGDLLERPAWRQGFARLEERSLRFDLQLNPHQFRKAARLLARHPGIPIIIGHLGSPTERDLRDGRVYWDGLRALAELDQTCLKISMLSYPDAEWERSALVRESVHRAIDLFGVERCLFASNFPVEKHVGWPAARLYRAFRDLAAHLPPADRQRLFADNARRIYGVPERGMREAEPPGEEPAASSP